MSKSPNILAPALGATCLVLGVAYGVSTKSYNADKTIAAQQAAEAAELRADMVTNRAGELERKLAEQSSKIATLNAELDDVQSGANHIRPSGTEPVSETNTKFGLGRPALAEEIAAWDIDVLPDGRGLPQGSGDVLTGEEVFADRCGACHGDFAEGVGNWPVLAGGFDTLADEDPVKTVGSYWPYLSTVWDYVNRSMPFGEAQTLTADETYAIVAYILYSNDVVEDEDFVLSHENFADIELYNAEGFVIDDRQEREYANWRAEPCMENCKQNVEITRRASAVNVTPVDEFMHPVMRGEMLETKTASVGESAEDDNAALVAEGEKVFKKCKACHQVGPGAKNRSGPHLNGLIGRQVGGIEGFKYSNAMQNADLTWNAETLAGFLADPKAYLKGTKMSFRGLAKQNDLDAIIAYLASVSQ